MDKRLPVMAAEREIEYDRTGMLDLPFLVLTLLLVAIGLIMVFSASFASAYSETGNAGYYFRRQLLFTIAGVAIMFAASRVNYQGFRFLAFPILGAALLFLLLVPFIGFGEEETGANRWLGIGSFSFQPSEIAKMAVVLSFGAIISKNQEKMESFRYGVLPYVAILLVIVALLLKEPHLSASVIVLILGAAMMFIGGVKLRYFVVCGAVVGGVVAVALGFDLLPEYAQSRLDIWQDPFLDPSDSGYQMVQSLYALGSGGFLGLGLGRSRQKYLYLPEEHNDFIFAIVGEELGFVGALLVIVLFALLVIRGYYLALHARDRFGTLIVAGFTTLLALQVVFNIAVVTNLIPTTGISLPFFSYGGTALIIQLFEMGIILSVSRQNRTKMTGGDGILSSLLERLGAGK